MFHTFLFATLVLADDRAPIYARWNDVCRVAQQHPLTLTGDTPDPVEGYCVSVDVSEIVIRTADQKMVRIAWSAVTKLEVEQVRGHRLRALRQGVHNSLKWGVGRVFSPAAPVGIVVIPVTLAWGATAAPFCLLGDVFGGSASRKREIRPIRDRAPASHSPDERH